LLAKPEEALARYDLTPEERQCLSELDEDRIAQEGTKLNDYVAVSDIRV
jgi:hypothetical protein